MNLEKAIVLLIGILAVALICLALGETMGSEWNDVAQTVALVSVGLGFFAIVIAAIGSRR